MRALVAAIEVLVRPTLFRSPRSLIVHIAASIAPLCVNRMRLARRLSRYSSPALRNQQADIDVVLRPQNKADHHLVAMARDRDRISIACAAPMLSQHFVTLSSRIYPAFVVLAGMPMERLAFIADLSDGEASGPGIVSFCSSDPHAILIPDHGFVVSRGYEAYRRFARSSTNGWRSRSDVILWRGSATGTGAITKAQLTARDPDLRPRVRLCLAMKDVPMADVKISGIAQSSNAALDRERLSAAGILGEYSSPIFWFGCKFAIDIDGNSNAWSNLIMRLLTGCCVLKVASPGGYRQWYYNKLQPWIHFVPVRSDLSDVIEQIAWCRANLDVCEHIAASGQALALSLDFKSEMAGSIQRICDAANAGNLRTTI